MTAPADPDRNYPALFLALDEVLEAFDQKGSMEEALRRSFESSADGFGVEKALLLVVEESAPWRLRALASRGLSEEETAACESGRSVPGVSSSCIREVLDKGVVVMVQDPERLADERRSNALRGRPYSVLCAPICDPRTRLTLAVLYFQNQGVAAAFGEIDRAWMEVYVRAVGRVVSSMGGAWRGPGEEAGP